MMELKADKCGIPVAEYATEGLGSRYDDRALSFKSPHPKNRKTKRNEYGKIR